MLGFTPSLIRCTHLNDYKVFRVITVMKGYIGISSKSFCEPIKVL